MKPEALGGAAQGPWNASKLLRAKLNGKCQAFCIPQPRPPILGSQPASKTAYCR